jgi:hypothetical protein
LRFEIGATRETDNSPICIHPHPSSLILTQRVGAVIAAC